MSLRLIATFERCAAAVHALHNVCRTACVHYKDRIAL